ncbi:MAG: hypothetical protein KGJ23_08465 [Euryarchaeota archaeon]|nr:hypothetical protein [Euryarchaeota archaeon]MDE1836635.1 hypothetical protein [Euryarchaeota archaeon]MDE1879170.1 hypothetical protein [Euryarchaeota archaeon]MDE2044605.1 hypothetical protein [Thermoplasmata archaeon]
MTLVLLPPPAKKVMCGIDGCRRCIPVRSLPRHIGWKHGKDRIERAREFLARTKAGLCIEGEVNELVIFAEELQLQLARPTPEPTNTTADPWTVRGEP